MQKGYLISFAALISCATTLLAQTPAQTPAPPPSQSLPAPKATPSDTIESEPAYAPKNKPSTQAIPPPKVSPPPVAPPAPVTPETPYRAYMPYEQPLVTVTMDRYAGSVYIPLDSWMYPALTRLYSLGYLDTMFLGMRPWTRRSVLHMLQKSREAIVNSDDEQAQEILAKLLTELDTEVPDGSRLRGLVYGMDSSYTRLMGIGGPVLRDSYHLGQTLNNDYGRPYQSGFNALAGASTINEWGPFSLYVRGEYQHAPSAAGYSNALASQLSFNDGILYAPPNEPQATIPAGPITAQNPFRLVEASLRACAGT